MAVQQYSLAIGGASVQMQARSLYARQAILQRSECRFAAYDLTGLAHFSAGQPVALKDSNGVLAFGGVIARSKEAADASVPNDPAHAVLLHDILCADWHYLADKRRFGYSNNNVSAGTITGDMLTQVLAAEGVYAVKNLLSANQSNVETNTTGFTVAGGGVVTLTRDTTEHWEGAASLKAVCDGTQANQGVFVGLASTAYLAGSRYTLSVQVKGTAGQNLYLVFRQA